MISTVKTLCIRFVKIGVFLLIAGCSTNVSRFQMPGTDLSQVRALYIRPIADERNTVELQSLIETNLRQRGFEIAVNDKIFAGRDDGYIFDAAADWHWDMSWYLLELRVAIYDPMDNTLIAQAHSRQTSLVRQSVDVIVERAIASLFNDTENLKEEE